MSGIIAQRRPFFEIAFADFRDPSADVVPQRFEVFNQSQVVTRDEAEWLARPDLWGTDLLGKRKSALAEEHTLVWLVTHVSDCEACHPLLQALWGGGQFDESVFDTEDWRSYFEWANQERAAGRTTKPHHLCTCGYNTVHRWCCYYLRGQITQQELTAKTRSDLCRRAVLTLSLTSSQSPPDEVRARRSAAWDFGRNLALDLCGPNPFRPVVFDPRWRSESAVGLARTAYDTRNFSLLPILADALEEAGCDHAEVLTHCRDPKGMHVRGCWLVDGVLGRG